MSSMRCPLEIQFTHSSFNSTMLNAVLVCSSNLSLGSGKCPDAGSGGAALGNGEETVHSPLSRMAHATRDWWAPNGATEYSEPKGTSKAPNCLGG